MRYDKIISISLYYKHNILYNNHILGKPASLACPTCIKLGLSPTRFCDQECFKQSWNEHKKLHTAVKKAKALADPSSMPPEFKGYNF